MRRELPFNTRFLLKMQSFEILVVKTIQFGEFNLCPLNKSVIVLYYFLKLFVRVVI